MVDTVWLRLTSVNGADTFYMFGPTGVVEFKREGNLTLLFKARGGQPDSVLEEPQYILDVIGRIRKTILPPKGKNDSKVKRRSKR